MSDDRRILLVLVIVVAASTTGDPTFTLAVGVVAWVLLRVFQPRRSTWDATSRHRARMEALRRHPTGRRDR